MRDTLWDAIIVGQGLAGTTLAWCLLEAGQRVLIIDACEPVTSSKIAAGLITPITGQRLVLNRKFDAFLTAARSFYSRIERRTGCKLLHERIARRIFRSEAERQTWAGRSRQSAYQRHLLQPQPQPLLEPALGNASGGGFAMHAAQLDVAAYLEASRTILPCKRMTLDWRRDVAFCAHAISVGEHRTRLLVSCEGFAATRNPFFSCVPFKAAKGDILTVRFQRCLPPDCLHCGIWLAPTSEADVFRVGSTYDWNTLDQTPSAAGRSQIERKLGDLLHEPYTVLDHRAAVRPIITESRARVGLHPQFERLGYFNGLGSKGALHAPWYAQCLSDLLVDRAPVPEHMDVRRHF